jgi:hypothetical protein
MTAQGCFKLIQLFAVGGNGQKLLDAALSSYGCSGGEVGSKKYNCS